MKGQSNRHDNTPFRVVWRNRLFSPWQRLPLRAIYSTKIDGNCQQEASPRPAMTQGTMTPKPCPAEEKRIATPVCGLARSDGSKERRAAGRRTRSRNRGTSRGTRAAVSVSSATERSEALSARCAGRRSVKSVRRTRRTGQERLPFGATAVSSLAGNTVSSFPRERRNGVVFRCVCGS